MMQDATTDFHWHMMPLLHTYIDPQPVVGDAMGASYSSVTKPLSKATLAMKLPLISYAATNRDLSHHKVRADHLTCPG